MSPKASVLEASLIESAEFTSSVIAVVRRVAAINASTVEMKDCIVATVIDKLCVQSECGTMKGLHRSKKATEDP